MSNVVKKNPKLSWSARQNKYIVNLFEEQDGCSGSFNSFGGIT